VGAAIHGHILIRRLAALIGSGFETLADSNRPWAAKEGSRRS